MIPPTDDKKFFRYFEGSGAALKVISHALEEARVVRIATAYFEPSGYQCLREVLRNKEVRLLLGRPDIGTDKIREVISEFFEALSRGPAEDRTRAMEELCASLERGVFHVYIASGSDVTAGTLSPRYLYQHAKLYIADERCAVVGSSNFTYHGLVASREAGIAVTDPDDVAFFVERFDHYFNKATPVAQDLMEMLKRWLQVYRPFDVYIRSLLELYGLPDDVNRGRLPELAAYQRPVVSRIIRNFDEHGGSMLVASTGLGKTIMAAHLLAYLRTQGTVDSAIILCPAGLKAMWSRTMRAARVSSMEFSYYVLSVEDWKKYREIGIMEHELKQADEKTVIILDESHHMRNAEKSGEMRKRNRRIMESVGREARVLLMTATPYSRTVNDINDQLMLLPHKGREDSLLPLDVERPWKVQRPGDLSEIPPGVVLTAPSVVKYFSSRDEAGNRYVLFSGDQKRFFPGKMHIRNIDYENILDDMLLELLGSGLLNRRTITGDVEEAFLFDDVSTGTRNALFEAHLVHQFCSSLREVEFLLRKMEVEGGFASLRFADQERLSEYVHSVLCGLHPVLADDTESCRDAKITSLLAVLDRFPGTKAVIFCHYRETARYVEECVRRFRPGRVAESTVDKKPDDIERIIRRFAPEANSIDLDDDESEPGDGAGEIDVLVATGAMSEGFNFQDAPVLVNFDLPWTVLVLAQRMGRILRPWHEPRDVHIFNLIPSTMENKKIHHALNWKERLHARNREFSSFSEIPVMVEKGSDFEMIELARSIGQVGDADLDLDQVFQFIENADQLTTSSFIDDLARLAPDEIAALRKLPGGIKSHKAADVKMPELYLLLRYLDRLYPVLFNRRGEVILDSEKMDEIMNVIRSDRDEEPCLYAANPDEIDRWVAMSRNRWAVSRKAGPDDIEIVCRMILVPFSPR